MKKSWRRLAAWRGDERAAVAIEFALIGPAAVLLMLGIFEAAFMMMAQNMLNKSAQQITQLVRSGATIDGSLDVRSAAADFACGANQPGGARSIRFFNCDSGLQVYLKGFNEVSAVVLPEAGSPGSQGEIEMPERGQFVVLRLYYDWQFFVPFLNSLAAKAAIRPLLKAGSVFRVDN